MADRDFDIHEKLADIREIIGRLDERSIQIEKRFDAMDSSAKKWGGTAGVAGSVLVTALQHFFGIGGGPSQP